MMRCFFSQLWRFFRAGGSLVAWGAAGLVAVVAAQEASKKDTVRVTFDAVVRPVAFLDEQGRPAGFAADYLRAIAREAGFEPEFITGPRDKLWAEFAAGRVEVVASLVFTEERAKTMDFALPYLRLEGAVFAAREGKRVRSLADLAGRRVAVSRGNVTHDYLRAHPEWKIEIVPVDSTEAALRLVHEGGCDAAINIALVAEKIIRERGLDRVVREDVQLPGLVYKYHMAVKRGDAALLRRINEAQWVLHERGEFERLHEKWIGPLKVRELDVRELRPYLWPAVAVLVAVVALFVWQRRNLVRFERQAEALRQSEERLNLVLESGRHCLWDWDVAAGRVMRGPLLAVTLGYRPEELAPTPEGMTRLLHPENGRAVSELEEIFRQAGVDEFASEVRLRTKAGAWRWFTTAGRVLKRGPDGRALRAVGTHTDITERKAAEEALRESERRHSVVVEQTGQMIYDLDVASGVNLWFGAAAVEKITGYTLAEFQAVTLRGWSEMIHAEDRPGALAEFDRCCAAGLRYDAIYRFRRKDLSYRTIQDFGVFLRDEQGKVVRMLGAMADVTERRESEEAIRRLNAELEHRVAERTAELARRVAEVERLNAEQQDLMRNLRTSEQAADRSAARLQEANSNLLTANQELEAFSYSVSHDLRAPLRNITGFIELLARRSAAKLDEESNRFLAVITTEATRMGMLIDDLLTFSRIGRAEMKRERVELAALVAEVCGELANETAGRAVEWRIGPLPVVRGDRVLLRQVVANLLGNAAKFTRRRETAVIEVGTAPAREGDAMVVVFVRDNGAGFNPRYLDKLFGVFQRLHNSRNFEGTGIGLANVKRIVTRHGGRVWAEGQVEKGATFYFALAQADEGRREAA